MKPKHYKPEYAVAQTVADMQRKFVYPDEDTQPATPFVGGGGGAMTIQVAASDAHDIEKGKADLPVASGVNDEAVINAAANLIHASDVNAGGQIWLSSGTFNINLGALNIGNRIILKGVSGYDTRLVATGTGTMLTTGTNCVVRDLTIFGTGSGTRLGIDMGNGSIVENCWFNGVNPAIEPANQCIIRGNRLIAGVQKFVDGSAGFQSVAIVDNLEVADIEVAGNWWLIKGNVISTGADGIVVNGNANRIIGNDIDAGVNGIVFTGTNTGQFTVVANNRINAEDMGIIFGGASRPDSVVIEGNVIDCGAFGIGLGELEGDGISIIGNSIVNGTDGIVWRNQGVISIVGNDIRNVSDHGIHGAYTTTPNATVAATVSGNSIDNCGQSGILIHKTIDPYISVPMVITGNIIGDVANVGIRTIRLNDVSINGNHIASAATGIEVTGDRVAVIGNTVTNPGDVGVGVLAGSDSAVYANYLGDASAYTTAAFQDSGTGTITAPGGDGQLSY